MPGPLPVLRCCLNVPPHLGGDVPPSVLVLDYGGRTHDLVHYLRPHAPLEQVADALVDPLAPVLSALLFQLTPVLRWDLLKNPLILDLVKRDLAIGHHGLRAKLRPEYVGVVGHQAAMARS